jgi:hypothetical protein
MIDKAKEMAAGMYSAIKPYEKYIGLAALVLVIDHFMFNGKFGGRLRNIAEQVMDKFLAAFDKMLEKLGIDLDLDEDTGAPNDTAAEAEDAAAEDAEPGTAAGAETATRTAAGPKSVDDEPAAAA